MNKWQVALCYVTVFMWPSENTGFGNKHPLFPGKVVLNAIPEILRHPTTMPSEVTKPGLSAESEKTAIADVNMELKKSINDNAPDTPGSYDQPGQLHNSNPDYPPGHSGPPPGHPGPPPENPGPPPGNPDYQPDDQNYPPGNSDYPPGGDKYPPSNPEYPPDDPNYSPDDTSYPPDATKNPPNQHSVQYAALPRGLAVVPLPLDDSDHELKLNISWQAGLGVPANDYSLEVRSVTDTVDCRSPMCYDYNIPGDLAMWTIPVYSNPVAETCAVRPGCAYHVRLIAHPWDGHTAANLFVELDECVAGVCSCGHAPRLPMPRVNARMVTIQQEMFANITWSLPRPTYPYRLPPGIYKKNYVVSIGKQMVSNAHPAPWFANTITRQVDADGPVTEGDDTRWLILPIDERTVERRDKRTRKIAPDVKLLARVSLIDDRGCYGPAGNATVYDPAEPAVVSVGTYVLWAVFGGACVLTMGAVVALSARVAKRILNVFRPPGSSAPLNQIHRRPAWFPLQLRTQKNEEAVETLMSEYSEGRNIPHTQHGQTSHPDQNRMYTG